VCIDGKIYNLIINHNGTRKHFLMYEVMFPWRLTITVFSGYHTCMFFKNQQRFKYHLYPQHQGNYVAMHSYITALMLGIEIVSETLVFLKDRHV
jgi:spore cortex formation protein SpoVR/YcgB (stage V sporulation)